MKRLRWVGVAMFAIAILLLVLSQFAPQAEAEPAAQEDLETFVPSETLPAGSSISFPVDI